MSQHEDDCPDPEEKRGVHVTCPEPTAWITNVPDTPGWYWFYGWIAGEWKVTSRLNKELKTVTTNPRPPEFQIIQVVSAGDNVFRLIRGHNLSDYMPIRGCFQPLTPPAVASCTHLADSDEPLVGIESEPCELCGRWYVDDGDTGESVS